MLELDSDVSALLASAGGLQMETAVRRNTFKSNNIKMSRSLFTFDGMSQTCK